MLPSNTVVMTLGTGKAAKMDSNVLNYHLVGGFNPSENMKVSWGDYSQYIGK